MAMRMNPNMLTKDQWTLLRDIANKENKPSGDIALELIKQALDAQIAAKNSNTGNTGNTGDD